MKDFWTPSILLAKPFWLFEALSTGQLAPAVRYYLNGFKKAQKNAFLASDTRFGTRAPKHFYLHRLHPMVNSGRIF